MKIEDETGAFGKVRIDIKVTIHLQGHLLAGGKAEAIACSKIPDFEERLKDVLALLFRDALTRIRYEELMGLGTTFFVLQPDVAALWGIFCCIVQQMEQDVRNVLLIDIGRHLWGIDCQVDVLLDFITNLIHQTLAELWNLNILKHDVVVWCILEF